MQFRTSSSLRGAKRRGNLLSPIAKLCLAWGMVDFLFELPYFPRHCEEQSDVAISPFTALGAVWGMVDSICIFARGAKNIVSTSVCTGRSNMPPACCIYMGSNPHPRQKEKHHPKGWCFLFGGGWWIRTTEGIASRFTVCPLWPLGKSPIFISVRWSLCPSTVWSR